MRFYSPTLALMLLISFLWMLVPQTGESMTNYVSPGGDGSDGLTWATAFTNLQDALNNCTAGGDEIYVRYGTYTNIPSQLTISNATGLTIYGGYAGTASEPGDLTNLPTVLQARSGNRVLYATNSTLTLAALTIAGGNLGGGVGAGICAINCASVVISNSVVRNCQMSASGSGGGIYVSGGPLTLTDSAVMTNQISNAGAVSANGCGLFYSGSSLNVRNCDFAVNYTTSGDQGYFYGGAIYSANAAVVITNSRFRNCYAQVLYRGRAGGALYLTGGSAQIGSCIFSNCYVYETSAEGIASDWTYGGAIYATNVAPFDLLSSTGVYCWVRENARLREGGNMLYLTGSTGTLDGCVFDNAGLIGYTETIHVTGSGSLTIRDSTIRNSSADGIYFAGTADRLVLTNCMISGSWASGVRFAGATLAMTNCLVTGNAADGILLSGGTAVVANCTLADNLGWGLNRTGGTGTVVNSIAWANIAGGFTNTANLTVTYSCSQNTPYGGPGNIVNDPLFFYSYYLSSNGLVGQTSSSPCIDQGTGNTADWGLEGLTTCTSGTNDTGIVDMGYHYASGIGDWALSNSVLYVDAVNGNNAWDGLTWGTSVKSITNALAKVLRGGTINVATGTYSAANTSETFPLTVQNPNLSIVASNANRDMTVIDANALGKVIVAVNKGSLVLGGLTIRNGAIGGGSGAGVYAPNCASLVISNCVVRDCRMGSGSGAGIYASVGALTVLDSGIINDYVITNVNASGSGCGIRYAGSSLTVKNCDFATNYFSEIWDQGYFYGGAIYSANAAVAITNSRFRTCYGTAKYRGGGGGALYLTGGSAQIGSCIFSNCYVYETSTEGIASDWTYGGAIYATNVTPFNLLSSTGVYCWVRENARLREGGNMLYLAGSTGILDGCVFDNAGLVGYPDSIRLAASASVALREVEILNSASQGVYFIGRSLGMTNCLVIKSACDGLYVGSGTANVVNCAIVDNTNWGITNAATVIVKNSIIWTNKAGGIATNTTTIITYTDSQDTWVTDVGTGNISIDPLFVDPANGDYHEKSRRGSWHGGLWTGDDLTSPCIDAGEPYPASSYALEPNPNGRRVNMGAYGNTAQASISPIPQGAVFSLH